MPLVDARLDRAIERCGHMTDLPTETRRSSPEIRRRKAGSRALLRGIVHEVFGVETGSAIFDSDDNGKPRLRWDLPIAPPEISISHSRDAVFVAATHLGPIGVDIESRRHDRPLSQMALLAFGAKERDAAHASPRAFYRTWSLREAMSKVTGQGLAMALDRRDRFGDAPEYGCWLTNDEDGIWLFASLDIVEDHSAAVAVRCIPGNLPASYDENLISRWVPCDDDE